jgi:hypothetical protein
MLGLDDERPVLPDADPRAAITLTSQHSDTFRIFCLGPPAPPSPTLSDLFKRGLVKPGGLDGCEWVERHARAY